MKLMCEQISRDLSFGELKSAKVLYWSTNVFFLLHWRDPFYSFLAKDWLWVSRDALFLPPDGVICHLAVPDGSLLLLIWRLLLAQRSFLPCINKLANCPALPCPFWACLTHCDSTFFVVTTQKWEFSFWENQDLIWTQTNELILPNYTMNRVI